MNKVQIYMLVVVGLNGFMAGVQSGKEQNAKSLFGFIVYLGMMTPIVGRIFNWW